MRRTKRELISATRGGLSFVIPAGAPVGPASLPGRYWVQPNVFPADSIEHHDATYYGIEISEEDIEET